MLKHGIAFLHKAEIPDKINQLAGRGKSFLFAIDFGGENGFVLLPEEANTAGIKYQIGNHSNVTERARKALSVFNFSPVPFDIYEKAFYKIIDRLKRGDTYLLNLTFPTPLQTDLTLEEIFTISRAQYRLYVPGHFVVFSPEIFVRIKNSQIFSYPMKGTIDASLPDSKKLLLEDQKEFFEHNTIVDLIRNDLSMVSTGVTMTKFRFLELIQTNRGNLWQMSSEISGILPGGFRTVLGDLLLKLLPAGSVTGAPKERTVQIIRETELSDRGFYTGIFGYFDGTNLDSSVMIRFIENREGKQIFHSGGGITALSNAQSEYEELIQKIYVPII